MDKFGTRKHYCGYNIHAADMEVSVTFSPKAIKYAVNYAHNMKNQTLILFPSGKSRFTVIPVIKDSLLLLQHSLF